MEHFSAGQRSKARLAVVIAAIVIVALLILYLAGVFGGGVRRMTAKKLRCVASQQVTPFHDRILYYDGATIFA